MSSTYCMINSYKKIKLIRFLQLVGEEGNLCDKLGIECAMLMILVFNNTLCLEPFGYFSIQIFVTQLGLLNSYLGLESNFV